MPDRFSPAISAGLVATSAGLLAEEISALRKLAQDRRAASFVLFCNTVRLVPTLGRDAQGVLVAEPACNQALPADHRVR
jgi:hypothetical protein